MMPMKIFMIFCSILPFTLFAETIFQCAPLKKITWEEISEGVFFSEYDVSFTPYFKDQNAWDGNKTRKVTVRAIKVDPLKVKFRFHRPSSILPCEKGTKDRYIKKMIEDLNKEVIGAINSNFFIMPSKDILGVAYDGEKLWHDKLLDLPVTSSGVLSLKAQEVNLIPRDSFISLHGDIIKLSELYPYDLLLQAYPILINNDALVVSNGVKDVRYSRTAIGKAKNEASLILTTIDAKGFGVNTGMTLYEFGFLLKTKECGVPQEIALNLDGEGSTAISVPSKNMYHQVDSCRKLGNILTIQKL